MQRCHWVNEDPLYHQYHDTEWGVASKNPDYLFEMLILESFQAGLSWWTVLKKRDRLRQRLFEFNPRQLAYLTDDDINDCLQDPGIIRHRAKLEAARHNAQCWLRLSDPVDFIWSTTNHKTLIHHYQNAKDVPTQSAESRYLSTRLKQENFKFLGPTTCQAYLQAVGIFMDHTTDCFRYQELLPA